jgi:hypothetical protein
MPQLDNDRSNPSDKALLRRRFPPANWTKWVLISLVITLRARVHIRRHRDISGITEGKEAVLELVTLKGAPDVPSGSVSCAFDGLVRSSARARPVVQVAGHDTSLLITCFVDSTRSNCSLQHAKVYFIPSYIDACSNRGGLMQQLKWFPLSGTDSCVKNRRGARPCSGAIKSGAYL